MFVSCLGNWLENFFKERVEELGGVYECFNK